MLRPASLLQIIRTRTMHYHYYICKNEYICAWDTMLYCKLITAIDIHEKDSTVVRDSNVLTQCTDYIVYYPNLSGHVPS